MASRLCPVEYVQSDGPDSLAREIRVLRDRIAGDRSAGRPQDEVLESLVSAMASHLPLVPEGGTPYPEPTYDSEVPWEVPTAFPGVLTPDSLAHAIMAVWGRVNGAYQTGGYDDDIWTMAYILKGYAFYLSGRKFG